MMWHALLQQDYRSCYKWGGGGGLMESPCSSVLLSVYLILSRQYLLNRSTVLNQTWCSGVLSWGGVSCRKKKKNGTLSSTSRSQRGLMQSKYDFLLYLLNCRPFAMKRGLIVQQQKLKCSVGKKKKLLRSRSRSQPRFKMSVNNYLDDIF